MSECDWNSLIFECFWLVDTIYVKYEIAMKAYKFVLIKALLMNIVKQCVSSAVREYFKNKRKTGK